ncbi:MAG: hypothetical protein IK095_00820 [Oscillospiraceae bacterium]|nr:hypothetical protein [Oscillospiraceae bacterium]
MSYGDEYEAHGKIHSDGTIDVTISPKLDTAGCLIAMIVIGLIGVGVYALIEYFPEITAWVFRNMTDPKEPFFYLITPAAAVFLVYSFICMLIQKGPARRVPGSDGVFSLFLAHAEAGVKIYAIPFVLLIIFALITKQKFTDILMVGLGGVFLLLAFLFPLVPVSLIFAMLNNVIHKIQKEKRRR